MKSLEGKQATAYLDRILYVSPDPTRDNHPLTVLHAGLSILKAGRAMEETNIAVPIDTHGYPEITSMRSDVANHLRDLSASTNAMIASGLVMLDSIKSFSMDKAQQSLGQVRLTAETLNLLRKTVGNFSREAVELWKDERGKDFPLRRLDEWPGLLYLGKYGSHGGRDYALALKYLDAGGRFYNTAQLIVAARLTMDTPQVLAGLRVVEGSPSKFDYIRTFILPESNQRYQKVGFDLHDDTIPDLRKSCVQALADTDHPIILQAIANADFTELDTNSIDTYYGALYSMYRLYKKLERNVAPMVSKGDTDWADSLFESITAVKAMIDPFEGTSLASNLQGTWQCLVEEVAGTMSGMRTETVSASTHRFSEIEVAAALALNQGTKAWDITQLWPFPLIAAYLQRRKTNNS